MKIKWGALVVDGRNKIGGHVASKNRSGAYLRTKVTPVNPQSQFQSNIRAFFGAFSQKWSTLTDAQRSSWNGAVASWQTTDIFGDLKSPTGKNLFLKLNTNLALVNADEINDAPEKVEMPTSVLTGGVLDITDGDIDLSGIAIVANMYTTISATPPLSQGTTFVKNKLRDIYNEQSESFSTSDLYDAYIERFGVPVAGANIYMGVSYTSLTGQKTVRQTVKVSVVEP